MPKSALERTIDSGLIMRSGAGAAGAGGGAVLLPQHNDLPGLVVGDPHTQYLNTLRANALYVPLARQVMTGAGLAGGGSLAYNLQLNVVTSRLISTDGNAIGLTPGAAWQFVGTDAAGAPLYRPLAALAGNGLAENNGVLAVGAGAGLTVSANAVALTTPGGLSVSSGNSATGNHTHAVASSSNPGPAASLLASASDGSLTLPLFVATQRVQASLINTLAGSLVLEPALDLNLSPASNVVLLDGRRLTGTAGFASGFAGYGFELLYTGANKAQLEIDNLTVRGRMSVYELQINRIRGTNGALFVSDVAKVALWDTTGLPMNRYRIYFDQEITCGLAVGDLIRAQKWTGSTPNPLYQCNMQVVYLNPNNFLADLVSGDPPAAGMEFVRIGSATDASRRGSIYLTSSDGYAPYVDVISDIASFADWNSPGKVRLRLGRLDGLSLPGNQSNEFGMWAGTGVATTSQYVRLSNKGVLLNNVPFSMFNNAVETVHIGGWNDVWLGPSSADKRWSWDGATCAINGRVTATSGQIANWNIGIVDAYTLSSENLTISSGGAANARIEVGSGNDQAGIYAVTDDSDSVFWAGSSRANRYEATTPLRITRKGALFASNATLTGRLTAGNGHVVIGDYGFDMGVLSALNGMPYNDYSRWTWYMTPTTRTMKIAEMWLGDDSGLYAPTTPFEGRGHALWLRNNNTILPSIFLSSTTGLARVWADNYHGSGLADVEFDSIGANAVAVDGPLTTASLATDLVTLAPGDYLDTGRYGRLWCPGQVINGYSQGEYGPALTYDALYNGGWKGITSGRPMAAGVTEGRFWVTGSDAAVAANGAIGWTTRFSVAADGDAYLTGRLGGAWLTGASWTGGNGGAVGGRQAFGFRKFGDVLFLRGCVGLDGAGSGDVQIGTMPAGYIPAGTVAWATVTATGVTVLYITGANNANPGQIRMTSKAANQNYVTFDGVFYPV